ncbi:WecB UDP-N-acetylglucosamine 2-epimerase [Burkholderiales bacterium]|jgi:UDP-hydrolysing UDP-N-acetyl-D-glucosamine 2-epimerase
MSRRRICVYIGGRANYSSSKSILQNIKIHPALELLVIAGAASVIDRYGELTSVLQEDGFSADYRFFSLVEGETPLTMAKSAGLGLIEASSALDNLQPDLVLVIGDRYDVLPVAIASSFMNIPLAHTMGGEVTGTIDESIRHAITKLAHLHFPANEDAYQRIIRMGERPESVHNVGCPRNDIVLQTLHNQNSREVLAGLYRAHSGVGPELDLSGRFLLVSQHPVTTEYGENVSNMQKTLAALDRIRLPTLLLWPNSDAGSGEISRAIRVFRERHRPEWLHVFKDLPLETYIHLMSTTACLIGNSSSGVREGALLGTPVVNIGSRQSTRLRGRNVISVSNEDGEIEKAILKQLEHGRYEMDTLYGDGRAGVRIAEFLASAIPVVQKGIAY